MTTEVITLDGLQSSHEAIKSLWKRLRTELAFNRRFRLTVESEEADRRKALRGAFHSMLKDVSEQVWLIDPKTGLKYRNTVPVWKAHFKEQLFDIDSTEAASNDAYAAMLIQACAYASVDLGVYLSED